MKNFTDIDGSEWVATALEEDTPRHHGRWYLVLKPAGSDEPGYPLPEVRWKSRHTAERTIQSMGEFELRRRLRMADRRHGAPGMQRSPFGGWKKGGPGTKGGAPTG